MPVLLMVTRSPRVAWIILWGFAKKLHILELQAPLWTCIQVGWITDYVGDLDLRINHLPAPPQNTKLIELLLEKFTYILPNAWYHHFPMPYS